MEQDKYHTPVVFRVWKDPKYHNGVIALFPYENEGQGNCLSYEHVGQHGPAHYTGVMSITRPATPEEYADLKEELESIGYRLRIVQKRGVQ